MDTLITKSFLKHTISQNRWSEHRETIRVLFYITNDLDIVNVLELYPSFFKQESYKFSTTHQWPIQEFPIICHYL